MLKKKFNKLIGLKKDDFDQFVLSGQIKKQNARLIPTLKTGDEMALTSIFLSVLRLVKEYRYNFFKEIKLSRSGKAYYYTEVCFPEISKCRYDGLIIIVVSGVIKDAVFLELKNKNNSIDQIQIVSYIKDLKNIGVKSLITVSNQFVSDSSHSPVNVKVPKNFSLHHFSWTYLLTLGQLLLFKNDNIIEDEDQIEIMREALYYFESKVSGVSGYSRMKPGWKQLSDDIRAQKPLKLSDIYIEDAVLSWHEKEKDLALLMSRKLGVLVKSTPKKKDCLKNDIKKLVKENYLLGTLSIKNSVSDIKIKLEFERRSVLMSVKILPPMDKGTVAKITWIAKQLENCKKKSEIVFNKLSDYIWIEADIKYARNNLKVKLNELDKLKEEAKDSEIQAFHVVLIDGLGVGFASTGKFISLIEEMVLNYYEGIVQHMTNWSRPAPKLELH
ncbi:hypothetical protein [Hanstruepera marina]|uniref:hypothetical protein n=1 Tax=Hanstruepera marina TaxID=2873265 RepID=UPI001CA68F91|nr:hypothetical protein [Hanstruepera marina]